MTFDTTIIGGTVVDGSGKARYEADVGILDGRITAIGDLGQTETRRSIDATDHVVTPGFIDMHSHSDRTLIDDRNAESKVYQGVTTEVVGNCSYSIRSPSGRWALPRYPAPISPKSSGRGPTSTGTPNSSSRTA